MIEIHAGDITELDVDVIVNAANSGLRGGGGVDGAIHRAAGAELIEYNHGRRCPTGQARLSPGFRLRARWIVHAVGPVWQGDGDEEDALLESAYRASFRLAQDVDARSIAFPAISTGVYGFPKERAAKIAIAVMREFEPNFSRIIACCFSADDAAIYRALLD